MKFASGVRGGLLAGCALWFISVSSGCGSDAGGQNRGNGHAGSAPAAGRPAADPPDSVVAEHPWVPKPIHAAPPPRTSHAGAAVAARIDSGRPPAAMDSAAGALSPPKQTVSAAKRRYSLTAADSARWPVKGPAPLPGALLPGNRIIAFYGNPKSTRMGILGQLPPAEMLSKLERTATEWAAADTTRGVMPALHLIATVAQGRPGPGGKYRLRHSDQTIEQVLGWAEERGWVAFLVVQIGHSSVADELPHLVKYFERPYVHLALDPEFAMKRGGVPGRRIGTLDAADVNYAVRFLADIVEKKKLPPKVLVVHRFTQRMLTNHGQIRLDPRVEVVVDMDGFGAPNFKEDAYKYFIVPEPVQYTGFKLFFRNDKPMMTPRQVLQLWPQPVYIQYQ
jgi:hypothetical protein